MQELTQSVISRRKFLRTLGLVGITATGMPIFLAACGDSDSGGATTTLGAATTLGAVGATTTLGATTTVGAVGLTGKTIGFSLGTLAQRRWQIDKRFIEEQAKLLGMEVLVQAAEDDEQLQISQAENLIAQGIDALIISPINVETVTPAVVAAKEAGIPVISYNSVVIGTPIDYWVARDNTAVGELQAQLAVAANPTGNYLIISGEGGIDVAQEKTQGNMNVLQPLIDSGDITLVSQEYHRAWDPALGLAQTENAISTAGDITAILANYDGFVLSSLGALREVGAAGTTWLGGEDVFEEVAIAIVGGDVAMSVYTDLEEMATKAVLAAGALIQGETPESNAALDNGSGSIPGSRIAAIAVTEENMREFLEETGWLDVDTVFGS